MATWFIETEAKGVKPFPPFMRKLEKLIFGPSGLVILSARADRLERDNDGNWTIVDYKTGVIPSLMSVRNGLSNQLAVEGLIAEEGGFGSLPPGKVRALEYWQIGGNRSTPGEIKLRLSDDFDAVEKRKFLEELVGSYDDPKRGYPSEPNPNVVLSFNPYEQP